MSKSGSSFYDNGADPAFIPAEIRGYRMWTYRHDSGPLLRAVAMGYEWLRGVNKAFCAYNYDHEPPVKDCRATGHGCGFYGWHTGFPDGFEDPIKYPVLGVIRVSGRIILGTKGFRAEKAEIEALAPALPRTMQADAVRDIAARYEVRYMPSGEDAFAEFPPDDLSSLFPSPLEGPVSEVEWEPMAAAFDQASSGMAMFYDNLTGALGAFREWREEWLQNFPTDDDGDALHAIQCCCRKCYFVARARSYKEWGRIDRIRRPTSIPKPRFMI